MTRHFSRRSFFTASAATLAGTGLTPFALSAAPGADPVFAAIRAVQDAWDEYGRAIERIDTLEGFPKTKEGYQAAEAVMTERLFHHWDTFQETLAVLPTTPAGLAALIRFACVHSELTGGMDTHKEALEILAKSFDRLTASAAI